MHKSREDSTRINLNLVSGAADFEQFNQEHTPDDLTAVVVELILILAGVNKRKIARLRNARENISKNNFIFAGDLLIFETSRLAFRRVFNWLAKSTHPLHNITLNYL